MVLLETLAQREPTAFLVLLVVLDLMVCRERMPNLDRWVLLGEMDGRVHNTYIPAVVPYT